MAALVQTIPQQTATVPILQSRPASSSSTFSTSNNTPTTASTTTPTTTTTMPRKSHNASGSSGSSRSGQQGVTPTTTSQTNNSNNNNRRQSWAPQLTTQNNNNTTTTTTTTTQPSAAGPAIHTSQDDSALASQQQTQNTTTTTTNNIPLRPLSTVNIPSSSSLMNISSPTVAKTSPDRYRRGNRRSEVPASTSSNTSSSSTPTDNAAAGFTALPQTSRDDSHLPSSSAAQPRGHTRVSSADESARGDRPQTELAKRYRRRSWGTMENSGLINLQLHLPAASPGPTSGGQDYFDQTPHSQSTSQPPSQPHPPSSIRSQSSASSGRDVSPVRGPSKAEETKRTSKPSPLSQPISADSESNPPTPQAATHNTTENNTKDRPASPAVSPSPATQRLAEVNANEARKPGKSRLRRAFSFGSASELIKASNGAQKKEALAVEKTRREMLNEELGPEQAAIAEQQEASGLGESIYSHYQGHLFNRSTDNISVSSTASSASVMLRKMGRGVKRSSRSLVGMFRPKSTVGTPSENPQVDGSAPQVSMVNIEADRNSVSVNADPQDMPRGGTVFPKVEPNSAEGSNADQSRRSIIGGERERSEVLAAVRKGILKKTNSETALATSTKLAPVPATGSESPHSSSPSTPDDQTRAGKGVKIAGEDYFGSDVKPTPSPPMAASKSLVFSPRIQLHDTWTSGEYDRRGEIATCNRLTPLLAQQIKEELNNFKMEMEVHETSKVYTHFL